MSEPRVEETYKYLLLHKSELPWKWVQQYTDIPIVHDPNIIMEALQDIKKAGPTDTFFYRLMGDIPSNRGAFIMAIGFFQWIFIHPIILHRN